MKNIYLGNLPSSTTEDELRSLFSAYGEVGAVSLPRDHNSHEVRGFAFVEMPNDIDTQKTMIELDGSRTKGRTLVVNEARRRSEDHAG